MYNNFLEGKKVGVPEMKDVLFVEVGKDLLQAAKDEIGGTCVVYLDRGDIEAMVDKYDDTNFHYLCAELYEMLEPEHDGVVIF